MLVENGNHRGVYGINSGKWTTFCTQPAHVCMFDGSPESEKKSAFGGRGKQLEHPPTHIYTRPRSLEQDLHWAAIIVENARLKGKPTQSQRGASRRYNRQRHRHSGQTVLVLGPRKSKARRCRQSHIGR